MGNWWTPTFRQDMLHVQLFCINFVICFSAGLRSPHGMSDALRQSHPHMFGLYIFAEFLALLFSVSALIIFAIFALRSATCVPYDVALLSALALGSYSVLLVSYGWFLFSLPVRGLIYWLSRERSGMDPTALEVLISKPASVGSIVTVLLYCLSLGMQSIASFAGLRSTMTPHAIIIVTIISLQCGVSTLTHSHPPQLETLAAPTLMSEP
uniref:Uncharacterized protein LOC105044937 n=1 Tax=Elaeis guineensis var. tenera TaxID=51953 RepID=A0A6J0PI57_ELAGV|nr:uncharacterized protein LOC105044937 [Elaeis guineensis]XP_019706217.1 uncharacterized protein LOC105044937 [Elaeis guineensis]